MLIFNLVFFIFNNIIIDRNISRLHREYADPSNASNTARLNSTITDINSIMKKNINEILDRGVVLDSIVDQSRDMKEKSKNFAWGAKQLNIQAMLRQYAPCIGLGVILTGTIYWKFFL